MNWLLVYLTPTSIFALNLHFASYLSCFHSHLHFNLWIFWSNSHHIFLKLTHSEEIIAYFLHCVFCPCIHLLLVWVFFIVYHLSQHLSVVSQTLTSLILMHVCFNQVFWMCYTHKRIFVGGYNTFQLVHLQWKRINLRSVKKKGWNVAHVLWLI